MADVAETIVSVVISNIPDTVTTEAFKTFAKSYGVTWRKLSVQESSKVGRIEVVLDVLDVLAVKTVAMLYGRVLNGARIRARRVTK